MCLSVNSGTRTHNRRRHKTLLYQLSYEHNVRDRVRTYDLLGVNQMLSQLSYANRL